VRTRQGFTLVELLCVLAIILLLLAILMPSMSSLKMRATRTICESHMMRYGRMGQAYLEDNDYAFPAPDEWLYSPTSNSISHPIGCRWHDRAMAPGGEMMATTPDYRGKMWAYTADAPVLLCPVFRDVSPAFGCENPEHRKGMPIEPQYSYTMNAYLGSEGVGGVRRLSEVRDTAKVFFFAEENSWSLSYATKTLPQLLSTKALDDTALSISCTDQPIDCFATYHGATSEDLDNGSGNAVFLDGHVEAIAAKDQLRGVRRGSWREPSGNLFWAWPQRSAPPGGWDGERQDGGNQ